MLVTTTNQLIAINHQSFIGRQEASRLLQECTVSQYMEKVLQRRDEEDLRSRKFLHPSSYSKVRSQCEQRMVADHLQAIHNEFSTMVRDELLQDLFNAYALLKVKTVCHSIRLTVLRANYDLLLRFS